MTSATTTAMSDSFLTNCSLSENDIKEKLLKLEQLPTTISKWDVHFKLNYNEEPAVYVNATVIEDDLEDDKILYSDNKTRFKKRRETRDIVRRELGEIVDHENFIYVYFV